MKCLRNRGQTLSWQTGKGAAETAAKNIDHEVWQNGDAGPNDLAGSDGPDADEMGSDWFLRIKIDDRQGRTTGKYQKFADAKSCGLCVFDSRVRRFCWIKA